MGSYDLTPPIIPDEDPFTKKKESFIFKSNIKRFGTAETENPGPGHYR